MSLPLLRRPRSFLSAPRNAISGRTQFLECESTRVVFSAIEICQIWRDFREMRFRWWTRPEVAILGADRKDRGLCGREWIWVTLLRLRTQEVATSFYRFQWSHSVLLHLLLLWILFSVFGPSHEDESHCDRFFRSWWCWLSQSGNLCLQYLPH